MSAHTLSTIIEEAITLIENNVSKHVGNMSLVQAIDTIERLQMIREREAQYTKQKACKACIKKAQKKKSNGL